jgi:hypothetical protein
MIGNKQNFALSVITKVLTAGARLSRGSPRKLKFYWMAGLAKPLAGPVNHKRLPDWRIIIRTFGISAG